MGERDAPYGTNEYDWVHPTANPRWLLRAPLEGAKYCVIDGIAFETMKGAHIGYFVDRISMDGAYLGETFWAEKWADVKAVMSNWNNRPTNYLGTWDIEDVYGDEEGNTTQRVRDRGKRRHANMTPEQIEARRARNREYKARPKTEEQKQRIREVNANAQRRRTQRRQALAA